MTALSDLLAACDAVQRDTHAAASTKQMAGKLKAWAVSVVPTPAPPTAPLTPVPVGAPLFSDEFTAALDPAKWDVKAHGTWSPANVTTHDGLLDIAATKDAAGVWHGGEMQGLAPAYQYVGPRYMEARAVVPQGQGTWSAPIWEWGAPWGGNHVEIDVCEQLGSEPTKYHATIHVNGTESQGIVIDTGKVLADAFHRYGAAIYPDRVDFYFDGARVGTIPSSSVSAWPFVTTPMCAVIDLDMGGWGGPISVQPPVHLLVDYVKVWALA